MGATKDLWCKRAGTRYVIEVQSSHADVVLTLGEWDPSLTNMTRVFPERKVGNLPEPKTGWTFRCTPVVVRSLEHPTGPKAHQSALLTTIPDGHVEERCTRLTSVVFTEIQEACRRETESISAAVLLNSQIP
ncbi:hypothetical protein TNCV_1900651 [Trichonephila clavipes]|nr:hypothetical protein TNCV_1900651 [Trichonephila clavipes]